MGQSPSKGVRYASENPGRKKRSSQKACQLLMKREYVKRCELRRRPTKDFQRSIHTHDVVFPIMVITDL